MFKLADVSTNTPLGTPANIRIHFKFLKTRIIGLHCAADSMDIHSNFSRRLRKTFFCNIAFRPLEVIQGHWFWYQSKANPISAL